MNNKDPDDVEAEDDNDDDDEGNYWPLHNTLGSWVFP